MQYDDSHTTFTHAARHTASQTHQAHQTDTLIRHTGVPDASKLAKKIILLLLFSPHSPYRSFRFGVAKNQVYPPPPGREVAVPSLS